MKQTVSFLKTVETDSQFNTSIISALKRIYDAMELYRSLARYMGRKRQQHSFNVSRAAIRLALRHYPALRDEAELAGLLHDNAKRMPGPELLQFCHKYGIAVSAVEHAVPTLLHGKVGAALLEDRFSITGSRIKRAVEDHVTGRLGMGPLSRILFVADQMSADRVFPGVHELRAVALEDLDLAVYLVSRNKLLHIIDRGQPVEDGTVDLYNSYRRRVGKRAVAVSRKLSGRV